MLQDWLGHTVPTMQLLPGDMETTDAQLITPGSAILQCNVADHITAGALLFEQMCCFQGSVQILQFAEAPSLQECRKTHHMLSGWSSICSAAHWKTWLPIRMMVDLLHDI